ncbi:PKD domain-containing protein [Candidatus Saccharibacteria bacterium]|nr:PKD domain-containing protein [Candidatus Saccharibacteria bacterium]
MRLFASKRNKLLALALVVGLALVPAVRVAAGWGPDRPTFTWAAPANYITFNSITNNPVVGDERPFLAGKVATNPGNVVDNINVNDNDVVSLRVFYHNNAREDLNLVATNTRVKIFLPTIPATRTWATSFIVADNATPRAVSDTVDFSGARPFTLEYMPGTAQLWNNIFRGAALSDDIVTNTGALIGFDSINGRVPGCERFSGYVTIKVKVNMPGALTPAYACDLLNVDARDNRRVDANVDFTATGGAIFKNVNFAWGDGQSTLTSKTSAKHQYAKDGNYNIHATLTFDVGGTDKTATCSASVSFKQNKPVVKEVTKVTTLPNTGAGGIVGLFAGASGLAGLGHYFVTRRRG